MSDVRSGIEFYFNVVLVQPQFFFRPVDFHRDLHSFPTRRSSDLAQTGPGFDNIVTLRGTNYNGDGGGNWMRMNYVRNDSDSTNPHAPPFLLTCGLHDNGWPCNAATPCVGGGANTSFVQENGSINP